MGSTLAVAVFVVSGVLLLSFGGAIVASPVTLPALYLVVRSRPTRARRILGSVLAALTAAQVGWAVMYVTVGERSPAIWAVPVLAGAAVAWFVASAHGPVEARPRRAGSARRPG